MDRQPGRGKKGEQIYMKSRYSSKLAKYVPQRPCAERFRTCEGCYQAGSKWPTVYPSSESRPKKALRVFFNISTRVNLALHQQQLPGSSSEVLETKPQPLVIDFY
ncbi:uncharacterized [Tachysurus ichikawai]